MIGSPDRRPRKNIEQLLQMAGNSHQYQRNLLVLFILQFLFSSFIEMGFPIIFRDAVLLCPDGTICNETVACTPSQNPDLSPTVQSVAYTYDLVCERKKYLNICFNAFLYGGFFGSFYYGQIQERRGRKYVVHESMTIMLIGIIVSLFSGNVTLFSIGIFFVNFGFRGFYNAAVLTLTQVSSQTSRMTFPIFLHLGWALGQIIIAILGLIFTSWRVIFIITAAPLGALFVYGLRIVKESPRSLVVKMQFQQAKKIVQQIAEINERPMKPYQLQEERREADNIRGYENLVNGQIIASTKHYSYLSLFRFNSIRIRVFIIAYIWCAISLSYFCSANSTINSRKGLNFNLALAGALEIIGYLASAWICLNMLRLQFIKKLCIYGGIIHLLFYFVNPIREFEGAIPRMLIMILDMLTRMTMSMGNVFFVVYSVEVFPTCVRHFAIGLLGFATKFIYMIAPKYVKFWQIREIHPNFVIGLLLIGGFFFVNKLRETKGHFSDNLDEDDSGLLMTQITAGSAF